MLKNILNLEGVAVLKKDEQKSINGGLREPKCVETGTTRILYSGGEPVSMVCEYSCSDNTTRWGGCSVWG